MLVACLLAVTALGAAAIDSVPFAGPPITPTRAVVTRDSLTLGNNTLTATFTRAAGTFRLTRLRSDQTGLDQAWSDPNLFVIHLRSGARELASSTMALAGQPEEAALRPVAGAARRSAQLPGRMLRATFVDAATGLEARWRAVMTDGAHYLRCEVELRASRGPVAIDRIELARVALPGARLVGYTDGAPVATDHLFLGVEHPMAQNGVQPAGGWTPAEMRARGFDLRLTDLAGDAVQARFDYQRGSHRLDIAKVTLLAPDGTVLAEDAHPGFSGNAVEGNVYRLPLRAGMAAATLRVTIGGRPTETDSWGQVTVTGARLAAAPTEVVCALPRQSELPTGATWTASCGVGVYPAGQLRRAFLGYLERERAHPYRQYWHYNSWYDLNIGRNDDPEPRQRMTEAQCLEVIRAFGAELHDRRGVGLDGFVWDDGWDDWNTLWQFHAGFPAGFAKLRDAAAAQGAGMGAWLSPWGGYGESHARRVAYGQSQGYETNASGFSLGGPKYYAAFRDACLRMIRDYHQTYFKFDGIGGGAYATGAPVSIAPDLDGLVRLIGELRAASPDLFVNCTVGTWASPYWTFCADSIWRQGEDTSFAGRGNPREQWINYRDSLVFDRFASRSPLYPLNALMYHGVLLGPRANPARMPTPAQNLTSFLHELRMAAGYASGLGELYLSPALMTGEAWDALAECITWARAKQAVLVDAHWVGGDPRRNEVYGIAAWHPQHGGVLTLRNPDDQPRAFPLTVAAAFELPAGAPAGFELRSPWRTEAQRPALHADAAVPLTLTLGPFEVLTLETQPPARLP